MNCHGPYYLMRSKIVKDHLDRFPDAPSKTIARILFRDYPEYFKDVEEARNRIRYYRGAVGEAMRRDLKDKKHVKQVQPT